MRVGQGEPYRRRAESGADATAEIPPSGFPTNSLAPRECHGKETPMYVGLGTILIIILLFLLFRGVSGRRA